MKRRIKIFTAFIPVVIVLIALGFGWRSWDYDRIRNMDYETHSSPIMRQANVDFDEYLTRIRKAMTGNRLSIVNEYKIGDSMYEIIGQSDNFWLFANYINKVTIRINKVSVITTQTMQEGGEQTSQGEFLSYGGFIHAGSKAFLAIAFFGVMTVIVLSVRKESLPHIFPEAVESEDNLKKHGQCEDD